MKQFVALIICAFLFTNCNFTEQITINEDGSGRMEFAFDGSQFMQMAGDELLKESTEVVDSTFHFKEFLELKKDSISKLSTEEQNKLKAMKNFSMHMLMNPETKKMSFNLYTDFKNVNELKDMFSAMSKMQDLKGKKSELDLDTDKTTDLKYAFDGSTFSRNVKIVNKELHEQTVDSLAEAAMMFGSSIYKLKYHFPKPVKTVSNENAMYSADRKTVTIEYDFMEYLTNPEALNVEIILED